MFNEAPIFVVTGPPAAGKTSFCRALLQRYSHGLHLHVDDLRLWVVAGLADSFDWNDETERQFQIAEDATFDVALRYQKNGFAVAIDHCRNIPRMNVLCDARLGEVPHHRVCLLPSLEANLERNLKRTDKPFEPAELEGLIRSTQARFRSDSHLGWMTLDNSVMSIEEGVDAVLAELIRF